jgi:hypothetical protein
MCFSLARQYRVPIEQVKAKHQEFVDLGLNSNGELSRSAFEQAIRRHCKIPIDQDIPDHLGHSSWVQADKDKSGSLDFEEYFLWTLAHEYTEEWMVADEGERSLRQVARQHSFNLVDVETVKGVFEKFDVDNSGSIDEEEFRNCLWKLLGASKPTDISENMLKRYWLEVDADSSGSICLEEFVVWYMKFVRS